MQVHDLYANQILQSIENPAVWSLCDKLGRRYENCSGMQIQNLGAEGTARNFSGPSTHTSLSSIQLHKRLHSSHVGA